MPSRRSIMRRTFRLLLALVLVLSTAAPLLADTIRLKDGSVIRGQVIGFKDQQFTILIGGSAKGRRGQTIVYAEDVESIDFDGATSGGANSGELTARNNPPVMRPNDQPDNNVGPNSRVSDNTPPSSAGPPTFFTIKVGVR